MDTATPDATDATTAADVTPDGAQDAVPPTVAPDAAPREPVPEPGPLVLRQATPDHSLDMQVVAANPRYPLTRAVTFIATRDGAPQPDVRVRFSTLGDDVVSVFPPEVFTDAAGRARTALRADSTPGDLVLRAEAGVEGEVLSVAQTERVRVWSLIPSGRALNIRCSPRAVPAFLDHLGDPGQLADVSTTCEVQVADALGRPVGPGLTVLLMSEADVLPPAVETDANGRASFELRASAPRPRVVEETPSPLDGQVTVVAAVVGEEGFDDANGDGLYDPAIDLLHLQDDLPEPFIDADDSGDFEEGEPFLDLDGDGFWTPQDEVWSGETTIWAATRVLWVGPPVRPQPPLVVQCEGAGCLRSDACVQVLEPGTASGLEVQADLRDVRGNCALGAQGAATLRLDGEHLALISAQEVSAADVCTPGGEAVPGIARWRLVDRSPLYRGELDEAPVPPQRIEVRFTRWTPDRGAVTEVMATPICYRFPHW